MRRVVVVGAGMAAARLARGLVARGVDAEVTVLGEEAHPPYNRVLLTSVLEGTHRPDALALPTLGVDLRLGVRVVRIDRCAREVVLDDGARLAYDQLVLATGSIATQVEGPVHACWTLDDCLRLDAAVHPARSAVVVGGGLLGLQVARALAVRGLTVEVVERAAHLLPARIGPQAGAILARALSRLGTTVHTGVTAVRATHDGLVLDDGRTLPTDLVVQAVGGRPATALARAAGLDVRRGVVVDDTLTTSDPAIHAIGDCAEHRARTGGHVAPAWEQADVLADRLAGGDPTYAARPLVARLRAADLDVAVLGDRDAAGDVVEVSNPVTGSHRRLVVRDGVIVAAVLVGDLSRVGLITQYVDRGTVLAGHEPGQLVMAERAPGTPGDAAPTDLLADAAEVCSCAGVSAGAIRGCATLDAVRRTTRATTGCGGCAATVRHLLATRTTLEGATS